MIRITILNSLGFFFLDFLIPYVATLEIDATGTEMGIIFSVRTIGYLLLAPIAGSLADQFSSKLLILFGSVGRGIAYFSLYASIISNSLILMIIGNFLLGIMAGFFWIPLDILVSLKSRVENRSEAFGKRSAAMGQGTLYGAIIGFSLLGYFNANQPGNAYLMYSALVLYGISNIVAGLIFFQRIDESLIIGPIDDKNNNQSYWKFIKSLEKPFFFALFLMLFVMFLSSTNTSISKPFILVYLTTTIERDPTLASAAFIPSGITSMLIAPKLGKIADQLNAKIVISIGALAGAATTWALINTSNLVLFAFLLIIDTTIGTTTGLVIQNIISRISIQNRGKIFGLQTVFTDIGAIFGPVVGGLLWDYYNKKAPFIFSIGVEVLLIPFYVLAVIKITPHLVETLKTENVAHEVPL